MKPNLWDGLDLSFGSEERPEERPEDRTRIGQFYALMGSYVSDDLIQWLIKKEFFEIPASIKYHNAFDGGLVKHCWETTVNLVALTERLGLKWELPRSPFIVGMFHDLCKLEYYVRDEVSGEWIYNPTRVPSHGKLSVAMLSEFIDLTDEETACILWHMGAYETGTWDEMTEAIKKYPNAYWTHVADMTASQVDWNPNRNKPTKRFF